MFERLELADNLNPDRHVGVYTILDKIYSQARILTSQAT